MRKKIIAKLSSISLFLGLLFLGIYFRAGLSSIFNGMTTPFIKVGNEAINQSASALDLRSSKSSILAENQRLLDQIKILNQFKIENEFLRIENSRLNDLFNRIGEGDPILTKALTIPGRTMFDSILVDVGQKNATKKINTGDTVRVSQDILIGDISEIFSKSSRVSLFSTPDRTTEVYFSDSGTRSIANGLGGGNFKVLAPKDSVINPGDFVYAANYGGLILGIVSLVVDEPSDPFITVWFRLAVNPYELRDLFIYGREIDS